MDDLLSVLDDFDDRILELVERVYADSSNRTFPFALPDHILHSPAVRIYTDILQANPFRGCKADHIRRETRYTPREEFRCRNRPRLIAALALALYEARAIEQGRETTPQEMPWRTLDALWHLRAMCDLFVCLRDERGLSDVARSQTAYLHTDTLQQAFEVIQRVALALTPADYTLYNESILNRIGPPILFARMCGAFRAYGPSDKRYSQTKMDYTIAAILIQCGRESGLPHTVAARLRAREKRARKPAQD